MVRLPRSNRPCDFDLEGKLMERTLPFAEDAAHLHYNFVIVIACRGVFLWLGYR